MGCSLAQPPAAPAGDTGECGAFPSGHRCFALEAIRGAALGMEVREIQDRECAIASVFWRSWWRIAPLHSCYPSLITVQSRRPSFFVLSRFVRGLRHRTPALYRIGTRYSSCVLSSPLERFRNDLEAGLAATVVFRWSLRYSP